MSLRDGALLSLGTLTRIPVPPPGRVDRESGAVAMLLAPAAAVPLGVGTGTLVWLLGATGTPPLLVGLACAAFLAWATRMLHLDGISDTVDGLTASHDAERSLQVMRSGTAGPAGVLTLVVVVGVQTVGFAHLTADWRTALLAAVSVVVSRTALTLACLRGVPAARPTGLGAAVAGTVRPLLGVGVTLACVLAYWAVAWLSGASLLTYAGPLLAVAAVVGCVRLAVQRLGGVTGDVLGACVETSLVVLLFCSA